MLTGNKGEWSEIYTLLWLLGNGKVGVADSELNCSDESQFVSLDRVIRKEKGQSEVSYHYGKIICIADEMGECSAAIESDVFSEQAAYLFGEITASDGASFSVPETEAFLKQIFVKSLKAPSESKSDITLQVFDAISGTKPICGWSIKSELGCPPTLLNASGSTRFVYRVRGLSFEDVQRINSISTKSKVRDKIADILEHGIMSYYEMTSKEFNRNLRLIDCLFPAIIAEALVLSYSSGVSSCKEIVGMLESLDPLRIGKGLYEYKFKKFLLAVALGMTPKTEWDGRDDASGGYLVVRNDGVPVAFTIRNRNDFEDYLLSTTKFETASTSRHGFGDLYYDEGELRFSLALQIRFIS